MDQHICWIVFYRRKIFTSAFNFIRFYTKNNPIFFLLKYIFQDKQANLSILNEIRSDAWQLYSGFIHKSAPNQINFLSESLRDEFEISMGNSEEYLMLEKVTEEVVFF